MDKILTEKQIESLINDAFCPITISQNLLKTFGLKCGIFLSIAQENRRMDLNYSLEAQSKRAVLSNTEDVFKIMNISDKDKSEILRELEVKNILQIKTINQIHYYSLNEKEIAKLMWEAVV